ncbi:MAG TPA: nucleotidyltransferase family protein [Glaciecola sp.]|jgi:molybdenum cofactor cytidylyltransferase|nr:nucleotidyltransferase family protein [Glaciecola sp.]
MCSLSISKHYHIEALLLAAGESKRFNGSKQLALINGKPMLINTLAVLMHTNVELITVVLGAYAQAIQQALNESELSTTRNPKMRTVLALNWQQGMGASIAAGVKNIDEHATHVFIGLADQVAISAKQCNLMLKQSRENPDNIIAAFYNGKLGAPAIFPKTYFAELATLQNDHGARTILRTNLANIISVPMDEAAKDIDTTADLLSYISNPQRMKT